MDRESLLKRQEAIERRYNAYSKRRDNDTQEMLKLQGQFQLIEELLKEFQKEPEEKADEKASK